MSAPSLLPLDLEHNAQRSNTKPKTKTEALKANIVRRGTEKMAVTCVLRGAQNISHKHRIHACGTSLHATKQASRHSGLSGGSNGKHCFMT